MSIFNQWVRITTTQTKTEMTQESTTKLTAYGYFGGECVVEFTESGYSVLSDTREIKTGYLHICDDSADAITDACRDQIIKYFFTHERPEPGIGATPQKKYFSGMTTEEFEAIGNNGGRGVYA